VYTQMKAFQIFLSQHGLAQFSCYIAPSGVTLGLWQRLQRSLSVSGVQRLELMAAGGVAVASLLFILSVDSLWHLKNQGVGSSQS